MTVSSYKDGCMKTLRHLRPINSVQLLPNILMKDCTISGKYPYQKIMDKTTQLGMLTEERGLLSLTMDGANRLVETDQYWVEIYDDFTLKGSIFAPGVKDADDSIRIGDEVLVKKNNRLCGVGVALMSGTEMIRILPWGSSKNTPSYLSRI